MTLMEVVVSTLILTLSSAAALGVWNQAASEIHSAQQLDALALELEMARIAIDRWLEVDAALLHALDSSGSGCRFQPDVLVRVAAERLPPGSQLRSRWIPDPPSHGHWLELSGFVADSTSPVTRRQLFTPATYGLCPQEEQLR